MHLHFTFSQTWNVHKLPIGFVQPQKQLVLKVLWANACSSWTEDQPSNTKQSFTGCWGWKCCIKLQWQLAHSWEGFQYLQCVSWAPQVRIQLPSCFKRDGFLHGGKEVLFIRWLGALADVTFGLTVQVASDIVKACGIKDKRWDNLDHIAGHLCFVLYVNLCSIFWSQIGSYTERNEFWD